MVQGNGKRKRQNEIQMVRCCSSLFIFCSFPALFIFCSFPAICRCLSLFAFVVVLVVVR